MNSNKKIVCVGDPHGCLEELKELLEKINYDPSEHDVIIAGDNLDRGKFSVETLRFVKKMGFKCVFGNHEEKHVRYYKHRMKQKEDPKYKIPMRHPGKYMDVQMGLNDEDVAFMEAMPSYYLLENNWIVVHAGLEPFKTLEEQYRDRMCRIRYISKETFKTLSLTSELLQPPNSIFWTELYSGPYNVIYGHNVHSLSDPNIEVRPSGIKTVGIDTGCVFGGRLSAFILPDEEVVQIQSKKVYFQPFSEVK